MVKETVPTAKACSSQNARSCLNGVNKGSFKLFGVNISSDPIRPPEVTALRKSLSLGNIDALPANNDSDGNGDPIAAVDYHSDDQIHSKRKGKPWTNEEHRKFLIGLNDLGKGDWRGIAKKFVTTRTPTQVASHAQKHFIRLDGNTKIKRRASLFDMSLEDQKEKERNSQDASTSKTPAKQPVVVQGQTQTEVSNRFQNSMESRPVYQSVPPYYNFPSRMYHPVYVNRPEQIRFVHPSGIPLSRHVPINMPLSQPNAASNMTTTDGLEHSIALPPPPQATGATDLTGIAVKWVDRPWVKPSPYYYGQSLVHSTFKWSKRIDRTFWSN